MQAAEIDEGSLVDALVWAALLEVGDEESGAVDGAGFLDEAGFVDEDSGSVDRVGFVEDERTSVVGRALADVEDVDNMIVGRPGVVDSGFDPPQAATTTHSALTSDTTLRGIGKVRRLTTNSKGP